MSHSTAEKIKKILDIPMQDNDAKANTIGDYLVRLVRECWVRREGFSGKRPFGNSGWEYELYKALLTAGVVEGKIDEYGDIEELDTDMADTLILAAIYELYTRD